MADILITVRGDAEIRVSPELATVLLAATADGPDRVSVVEQATSAAAPLREDLTALAETPALASWSSGSATVWSDRPWSNDGRQLSLVHHAVIEVVATFTDVDALSQWVSGVAERDDIRVSHVDWELEPDTRAQLEQDVAGSAVRVAVARATAYAEALGRTHVEPAEIADVGLLSGRDGQPAPEARMFRAAAASMDAGSPGIDLRPAEIVVTATVEGRFLAR